MDRANIRAAGDCFERLIINREHGGSDDRFTIGTTQGDFEAGFLLRFQLGFRRFQRDIDHLAHGRQQHLFHCVVDFRTVHGDAFDEHVRHILQSERHLDFKALAIELDALRLTSGVACDVEEEPDIGILAVAVDAEFHRFSGFVIGLVRNEFQRAELPCLRIIASGAEDIEDGGTFRRRAALDRETGGKPVLSGRWRGEFLVNLTLGVRFRWP